MPLFDSLVCIHLLGLAVKGELVIVGCLLVVGRNRAIHPNVRQTEMISLERLLFLWILKGAFKSRLKSSI